jgi:hypothetical protein
VPNASRLAQRGPYRRGQTGAGVGARVGAALPGWTVQVGGEALRHLRRNRFGSCGSDADQGATAGDFTLIRFHKVDVEPRLMCRVSPIRSNRFPVSDHRSHALVAWTVIGLIFGAVNLALWAPVFGKACTGRDSKENEQH